MRDTVVIGGGFAGLSAATALAEAGVEVQLFEARPALGGRASAFTDPSTGERVDNGQHVLFGCYHETFRFLRRIGAEAGVRLQETLRVDLIDGHGRYTSLRCPSLPAPLHLLAGVLRWPALSVRDRIAILKMRKPLEALRKSSAYGHALPRADETVRAWLGRHGQTARLIELLWEPLAIAALNQPVSVASAASFAGVLRRLFSSNARDASIGLPSQALDDLYVHPSRRYIEARGGAVACQALARVVCPGTGHPLRVTVGTDEFQPRAVIVAVPWHTLAATIEDAPVALRAVLDRAEATGGSAIVTVNLWMGRRFTGTPVVGLPGRAFQWVFDKNALVDGMTHVALVASGADAIAALPNDAIRAIAVRELLEAFPAFNANDVRHTVVVRERQATFSVACGVPARSSTASDVPGLFLAGDWIDTGLPATIESATVSGHRAAAAVLAFRQRPS